jgi:SAM-dependent methyltransferase
MADSYLPIRSEAFWKERLDQVIGDPRNLHRCVYDVDELVWDDIQAWHKQTLESLVTNTRVLDAGCGYGALTEVLPRVAKYVGVDQSSSLLKAMDSLYPSYPNVQSSLDQLPFNDYEFDWAICRSIRTMTINNLGAVEWLRIELEMLRVARKLLILEYETPREFTVVRSGHARHKKLLSMRDRWSRIPRVTFSELPTGEEELPSAGAGQPDQRVAEAHPQESEIRLARHQRIGTGDDEDTEEP